MSSVSEFIKEWSQNYNDIFWVLIALLMASTMDTYNGCVWWTQHIHTMDMDSPLAKQLTVKKYHYISEITLWYRHRYRTH